MPILVAATVLLEFFTSGGLIGRGEGRTTIYRDYTVLYETAEGRKCSEKLTSNESARIRTVITHSRPERWVAKSIRARSDEIVSTLVYRGGREPRLTRWTERTAEGLPLALTILIHELGELRASALERCDPRTPDAGHAGKQD